MDTPGTNLNKVLGDISRSVDPAVQRALHLPSAEVIGKVWAKELGELVQSAREKRLENFGAQVDRAIEMNGQEGIDKIAETPEFLEWASAISAVDPSDKELLDVWQAALLALQGGKVTRLRILKIVKQLQPDEAAAFLAVADISRATELDEGRYRRRFEELGLVMSFREKFTGGRNRSVLHTLLFTSAYVAFFGFVSALFIDRFVVSTGEIGNLMIVATVLTLVALGSLIYRIAGRIELTTDGRELRLLVHDVLKSEKRGNATSNVKATQQSEE